MTTTLLKKGNPVEITVKPPPVVVDKVGDADLETTATGGNSTVAAVVPSVPLIFSSV